ncbi:MAG: Clp protease ClpP [Oscillospiraceae bacterium]
MRFVLNGYVVPDDDAPFYEWYGIHAVCPADLRRAVAAAEAAGESLTVEINSGGGSVFAGFEMYAILQNAKCGTVAEVQSISASATSVLMLGADSVTVFPVAQTMVHLPALSTEGDVFAHAQSVAVLNSITESILNAYVAKCGKKRTRAELKALMEAESWLSAQEALDIGLADSVVGDGSLDPLSIVAAAGGLPDLSKLRAEYRRQHPAPPPTADSVDPPDPADTIPFAQRAQARLELERMRYGGTQ